MRANTRIMLPKPTAGVEYITVNWDTDLGSNQVTKQVTKQGYKTGFKAKSKQSVSICHFVAIVTATPCKKGI